MGVGAAACLQHAALSLTICAFMRQHCCDRICVAKVAETQFRDFLTLTAPTTLARSHFKRLKAACRSARSLALAQLFRASSTISSPGNVLRPSLVKNTRSGALRICLSSRFCRLLPASLQFARCFSEAPLPMPTPCSMFLRSRVVPSRSQHRQQWTHAFRYQQACANQRPRASFYFFGRFALELPQPPGCPQQLLHVLLEAMKMSGCTMKMMTATLTILRTRL